MKLSTGITLLLLVALIAVSLTEAKKYKTIKNEKKAKDLELKSSSQKRSKKGVPERKILQKSENIPKDAVDDSIEVTDEKVVVPKKAKKEKPVKQKSKNLKVLTEYEQCKMECRRKRDMQDVKELQIQLLKEKCRSGAASADCSNEQLTDYITYLKEELQNAKKALNDALKNDANDEPSKSFIEINMNERQQSSGSAPGSK